MKRIFFILIVIIAIACEDDEIKKYHQFSKDDLSHLYYNKDTIVYNGEPLYYTDSVFFLINSADTMAYLVETEILSFPPMISISGTEDLYGNSKIHFKDDFFIKYAGINISKTSNNSQSNKHFEINIKNYINGFVFHVEDTFSLDTASVLGNVYTDVYKFYPIEPERSLNGVNSIYFAKKYGFIKIETINGNQIELIKRYENE